MVSPSKKHSRVANQSHKCKLIKGQKPLSKYKFYLDVENHHVSSKIETKIKELGGSIEFFLAKEVTHFITDKSINSDLGSSNSSQLHTPLTPFTPYLSESANVGSPNVSSANESRANSSKPRSRADAILQKARDQSCENIFKSNNPIQLAKTWGTPIWSTEHTLKFLRKISVTLKSDSSKGRPANVKHLHGDYVKIESQARSCRPYFQEIKAWPTVNLNSKFGFSPFAATEQTPVNRQQRSKTSKKTNKMTRKSRSKQIPTKTDYKRTSEKQCGYCEVCRGEYDVLSVHLQSKEHINFAKNSDNFLSLDSLINSSANVDTFLKMNSVAPKNDYDSGLFTKRSCRKFKEMIECGIPNERHNVIKSSFRLNGSAKMVTRRSNNRKSDLTLNSKSCMKRRPSKDANKSKEIESESAAQLRSRRESARRINYAEPREDEENNSDDLQAKIRIRGIRWRNPSVEDNISSASQPPVYKIGKDVKNKDAFSDQNKDPQNGLKVKICRVRESELSLLTNEADKFMFPPCLSDRPTDEDRQSTTDRDNYSTELSSSEADNSKRKRSSDLSYNKLDTNIKRKRRNQLQSFLEDNSDYYKFEKPDSRLRFPEAPVQPTLTTRTRTMTSYDVFADTGYNGDSEDRTGVKRNNQNEILVNDMIKRLKYSFERVPSSEPWYDAFQRQDECRERVFEYWGNTAYRKLPYEIGPMPPLASDCCSLSKIAHKTTNVNKVDRRFKSYRDQKKLTKKQPEPQSTEIINRDLFPPLETISKATFQDRISSKISREILNLQKNCSRTSNTKSQMIFPSSIGTRSDSRSILTNKPATPNEINKLSHKRNLTNEFVPTLNAETKEVKVKSAISNSRRNSLLDINGQPRKSPREHASTLAILSCLVQERKKREKELNGGISPDKMKNELNDDDREQTSDGSYGDESIDTCVITRVIKQEIESYDEDVESNDFQPASSHINNFKFEEVDVAGAIEANNIPVETTDHTKEDVKEDFKHPKRPRLDYVHPLKMYKEINDLLLTSFPDTLDDVPISIDKTNDLILIGTPKDFVEILVATAPGPLRYRSLVNLKKPTGLSSFSRGKKRRNNKTGWPTVPKRRIVAKKEIEEDSNSCSNLSATEPDDEIDEHQMNTDDRVDISEKLENGNDEFFIHSRQKLNSMGEDFSKDDEYSNDGNNSLLFPGTSDKAECSDIFTVSSDSLDTELTESNSKQLLDKDYDVISMKSIVNPSDEETSSADVTLAEMLQKQIGVGHKLVRSNRQKIVKKHSKTGNNLKLLQPIICVKKINDSQTLNKLANKNSPVKEQSIVRNSSLPNTKCSPRKLRKPRGRWYRER